MNRVGADGFSGSGANGEVGALHGIYATRRNDYYLAMNTASFGASVVRLLATTAALLLIPLLAIQLTDEMSWTAGDFAAAGALFFGAGMTYKIGARVFHTVRQRAVLGKLQARCRSRS